jgi:uncharacterized membrane protein
MRRVLAICTVSLAVLGIALSAEHFLDSDHYNPGFVEHPWVIRLHVFWGAVYLALALTQFSAPLRSRWPVVHRTIGRTTIAAGVVSGCTALVVTVLFPFHGPAAVVFVAPFALVFLFSLTRGLAMARRGNYARHREWMVRALAIGTGIATMRLIFVPTFLLFGEINDERARPLSLASFVIAFTIHLAVAEAWIRYTRRTAVALPALQAVGGAAGSRPLRG